MTVSRPHSGKYLKKMNADSTTSNSFRWTCFLLALANAETAGALSSLGDDICYFDMVHGDACQQINATMNHNDNANAAAALSPNHKNMSCLTNEISSVIRVDMENLTPRPDTPISNRLGSRGRPSSQSVEEVPRFQIGDVVELRLLETEPAPAAHAYYPSIIRGVLHEVGDDGNTHLKYAIERLTDGFLAIVPKEKLRSYEKYKYGVSKTYCRKKSNDPISGPTSLPPFTDCQVVADDFPEIVDHSNPHKRAQSFLSGQYTIVYGDNWSEVYRIPAHNIFSYDIL